MKQFMSLVLLSVGLLILSACAGEDETQQPPAPTATAETAATEEPEPTGMPVSSQTPEPTELKR